MDIRGKVAIVGIGQSEQGDLHGQSPEMSAAVAIKEALKDAGTDLSHVDGLVTCKSIQGTNTDVSLGPLLGHDFRYAQSLNYGTCTFSVHLAAQAIVTGLAETVVLVYGANARSARYPFGASAPTLAGASGLMHIAGQAGLALQRHKALYGTTDEEFGWIAVSAREWAAKNPVALFREPMTMEQYLARPYMVEPLRREDVTMLSDGGVALIMTSAEKVGEFPNKPAYMLGMSEQAQVRGEWGPDYLNRGYLAHSGEQIWKNTGMRPSDIDALYIQDPVAVWILQMIEYYGFAPVGEGGRWLAEGHHRPGGDMPINTNGGQLAESYMWGWLHMVEAVRQLRGEAGPRQIDGAEVAMCCSTQGFVKGGSTILSTNAE
jgi:acetyl-CoA acetyltransferase